MKLYLQPNAALWEPERYHYAAEQMMLTLFPGEKPEYPASQPRTMEEGPWACFFLSAHGPQARLTARVAWAGEEAEESALLPTPSPGDEGAYSALSGALKRAFYLAGTRLLGGSLPWGALTGVRPVKLPTRALAAGKNPGEAQRELEEKYFVSPPRAKLAVDCAQASLAAQRSLEPGQVSLYIGIPFCPTRCAYCSFVSADVGRSLKLMEPYVEALLQEVEEMGRVLEEAGLTIRSFYMGGGTPTTLSADQMDRLLSACRRFLPLEDCMEYTVEAGRPDTITQEKLEVLRSHEVGRISINPQTLEDHVLAAIGRRHSAGDIREAYALARRVGFECINMDLIAGLPQDSPEGFRRSLEGVLDMAPENITVHTLALKKGSALMERGGGLPSGEEVLHMLDFSRQALSGRGYAPYYLYRQKYMSGSLENVGWSLPGQESFYNIAMMEELHTVLSLGAGGVTKLVDTKTGRIVRLTNPKFPHDYLDAGEKLRHQRREILAFYGRAQGAADAPTGK